MIARRSVGRTLPMCACAACKELPWRATAKRGIGEGRDDQVTSLFLSGFQPNPFSSSLMKLNQQRIIAEPTAHRAHLTRALAISQCNIDEFPASIPHRIDGWIRLETCLEYAPNMPKTCLEHASKSHKSIPPSNRQLTPSKDWADISRRRSPYSVRNRGGIGGGENVRRPVGQVPSTTTKFRPAALLQPDSGRGAFALFLQSGDLSTTVMYDRDGVRDQNDIQATPPPLMPGLLLTCVNLNSTSQLTES
ncbi:hypothetical protein HaLaN_04098, partial [Haematococcus lacustris]